MVTLTGLDGIKDAVGQELGVSEWYEVTQERIDAFAAATDDHQWIHVDPERARDTPFGGTIAHGLFTLSLGPRFSYELFNVDGVAFGLNYGYAKVRFPAPVPVGSRLRMRATLQAADDVPGGLQLTVLQTFEIEGGDKPVCVAEALSRVYGQ
ncbi:MAG TPA: MaoC family dehydratase [Solirubrobacteraceae bacterium]|jgi:acyl dehydratase|nr:MaoC family dehydratase [Solirubrobacteraceae bacterium]